MNVSLTAELERYVAEKLAEGTYASQSEVVRAGLRLLIERDRLLERRSGGGEAEPEEIVEAVDAPGETRLPPMLRVHFPDYDAAALSLEHDRATVIGRLLQVPSLAAARWLRANVPGSDLAAFLVRRQGRGLDPKSLRFWGLVLDLPRGDVDRWVRTARESLWTERVAP